MTFHNVRLPEEIEKGALGGPEFHTTILPMSSGFEKRNIDWERPRGGWDLSYGVDTKDNLEDVLAFFYARQGRANTFRFKDWTDYVIGVDSTDTPQEIAIGDGATTKFQIKRRYTSGGIDFDRVVTRLVSGTVRAFVGAVEQTVTVDYTVDIESGILTFVVAPAVSLSVGVICEFDVPARFNTDNLDLSAVRDVSFSIPEIPIVEVKETLGSLT